jgi:hypothetical protein
MVADLLLLHSAFTEAEQTNKQMKIEIRRVSAGRKKRLW